MIHFIRDCIHCHNDWEVARCIGADKAVDEKNVIIVTGHLTASAPWQLKNLWHTACVIILKSVGSVEIDELTLDQYHAANRDTGPAPPHKKEGYR